MVYMFLSNNPSSGDINSLKFVPSKPVCEILWQNCTYRSVAVIHFDLSIYKKHVIISLPDVTSYDKKN